MDFLKGSKIFFLISILSALLVNACDMAAPQIIRAAIDSVIGDKPWELPAFAAGLEERINLQIMGLAVVVLAAASAGLRYVTMYFNSKGAERFAKTMRDRLFSHIQRLPFSWHMKNQTGDIIQRCTSDVDMIKNFISEQLTAVFRIVIMIGLSLFFMFSMYLK